MILLADSSDCEQICEITRADRRLFEVIRILHGIVVIAQQLGMHFVYEPFEVFGVVARAKLRHVWRAKRRIIWKKIDVSQFAGREPFDSSDCSSQSRKILDRRFIHDEETDGRWI